MIELRDYQKKALKEICQSLRSNDEPVLLECSVGGGKSYLIGSLSKLFENQNKRVLCLVSSSELVRNNSEAYKDFDAVPSVFCASLSQKSYDKNVIFATPQSVISAIKSNHPIKDIIFNVIIVDEAHMINFYSESSIFMRIFRHYKQEYAPMRILGLSGTPFRGDMSIVGKEAFFKTKTGNISTQYLIENKFLVPPVFGITKNEGFDFSKCKIKNTGEFNGRDLQAVIDSKKRLTWQILQEVQRIMESRDVCMVFCSTIPHCYEAMAALPEGQARMIIGETDDPSRNEALTLAREKKIKYLVSVACLLTGVNVPAINCIAWLRPTSSLLLYIQGIGRGLRLNEGKIDCLILDFAGNISRFSDIDDPIINEAIQPKEENEKQFVIPCYQCTTLNEVFSRRCCGVFNGARCTHFFEWKACPRCGIENDITARSCRSCHAELIDPNKKLFFASSNITLEVYSAKYYVTEVPVSGCAIINGEYKTNQGSVFECHYTTSEKAKNVFYAKFVKQHVLTPSKYYKALHSPSVMKSLIQNQEFKIPTHIICKKDIYGKFSISKKLFKVVEGLDN